MTKEARKDISKIVEKTNTQVGMMESNKKIAYARKHAGFSGWLAVMLGGLRPNNFRIMIDGKNQLNQKNNPKN